MADLIAVRVENGVVIDAIVATIEWATENLGGLWVQSDGPVWIGGTWDEINGFQPPAPLLLEE